MRKFGILAVAGLTSLVLAGAASAAAPPSCTAPTVPFPLSFNYAVVGNNTLAASVVTPTTSPLMAVACVDTSTGQFTINASDISIPSANVSIQGVPVTVAAGLAPQSQAT